jgi:TatA/E family protein of Tat protein translocase
MDIFTPGHIILILIGALVLFGPKRLPDIGKSLGKGIREFKGALNHITDDEPTAPVVPPPAPAQAQTVTHPVEAAPPPPVVPAPVDTPPPPPQAQA